MPRHLQIWLVLNLMLHLGVETLVNFFQHTFVPNGHWGVYVVGLQE